MLDHLLIQFAKLPRLGKVKTRLAPDIGEQACLELHCQLLKHTHDVLAHTKNELGGMTVLSIDQLGAHPLINELAKHTPLTVQQGNDLGERMAYAIRWGLGLARKVIIVGSDCPVLGEGYYRQAIEALDSEPHVFVNAEDGGYVLVGATAVCDELFEGIPWGCENVMQATLQQLQSANKKAAILGPLWDVDRMADYKRLRQLHPNWPEGIK